MVRFTTAHGAAAVAALARGVLVSGATLALAGCAATSWVTTRFADESPATASTAAAPAASAAAPAAPAATAAAPAQPSRFVAGTGAAAAAAPAAPMASAAGGGAGMVAAPLAPAALAARGSMTPTEAAAILADIEPAVEPLSAQGNRPYYAFGRRHVPFADERPYTERGAMGVIETRLQGRPTANGETHDMGAMTAAHLTLPLPSYVRVTNVKSGASTIVRVNDRGPARRDRLIELSTAAAERLQLRDGDQVEVVRLLPADIAQIQQRRAVAASVLAPAPVAAAMPVPAPAAAVAAQPLPPGSRAVAAPAAPAPAPTAAAYAQPMAAVPYPPAIGPVPPGMAGGALPSAVPGVAAGPMASGPMPPGSPVPVAAAAATGAAARAAAPAAPSDDLRSGRFSVQVATFAVESNAQTLRDRVAGQVKSAGINAPVRVISRNSRAVVAVGDLADKASADALADQLRRTLNQDVVVFRR
jgi:rare lipoprotein A